jgi:3-dehydroquinate dehydratase-1
VIPVKIGNLEVSYENPASIGCLGKDYKNQILEGEQYVHIFESRLDLFARRYLKKLEEIRKLTNKPILGTIRRKKDGGTWLDQKEEKRLKLFYEVINSGLVDVVDIETNSAINTLVVEAAKNKGLPVIASYHNKFYTPSDAIFDNVLKARDELGADIAKLAFTAKSMEDVIRLMTWTDKNYEKMIATMSMGEFAEGFRLYAHVLGSCLTYACIGQAVAPGQVEADLIKRFYNTYKPRSISLEEILRKPGFK